MRQEPTQVSILLQGNTVDFRGLIPMLGFLLLCRRFEQRLVTNWRQVQLNASWQRLYSQTDEAMQVMITELFDLAQDGPALQHMHELCTLHGPGLRVDLAIAVPLAQLWHSFFEVSSIGYRIQVVNPVLLSRHP